MATVTSSRRGRSEGSTIVPGTALQTQAELQDDRSAKRCLARFVEGQCEEKGQHEKGGWRFLREGVVIHHGFLIQHHHTIIMGGTMI
jgi:hypothetical protein